MSENKAASPAYSRPDHISRAIDKLRLPVSLSIDRSLHFTESMQRTEGQPLALRWAKAVANVLEHCPITILEEDIIVGKFSSGRYSFFYPELDAYSFSGDMDDLGKSFSSPETFEAIRLKILPYWQGKTFQEQVFSLLPEIMKRSFFIEANPHRPAFLVQESATVRHSLQWVPDYRKIIKGGFREIANTAQAHLANARDGEQKAFYEAVIILCQGVRLFAKRFAVLAEHLCHETQDSHRRDELLDIAERCHRIPWEPAKTFLDALQAQWFTQLVCRVEGECGGGNVSQGRMDQYLYEFYERDLADNRLSRQKAREYLDLLWCNIAQHVRLKLSPAGARLYEDFAHWEFITIGGKNPDGSDACNELSSLILHSALEFPLDYPYMGIRLHRNVSPEFLREICALVQKHEKCPVFLNDETIIPRQMENDAPASEAYDYCGSGFSEVRLPNRDTYLVGATWLNLPAILEMSLRDGYCSTNPGVRVGLATGDAKKIHSFSQLMSIFNVQLQHILGLAFQQQHILERLRSRHIASPFLSSLHDLCMKAGRDMSAGAIPGGRSIGGYIGVTGFATAVDSLAAINHLVFKQQRFSLPRLLEILADNFEGHEDVRQLCLNSPKYGNRVPWVDDIGRQIDGALLARAHSEMNEYGGRGEIFYVSIKAYIAMGMVTGATADGRYAGEKFSFGVTPSHAFTRMGPTVALMSELDTQNPEFCSLGARVMQPTLLPRHICAENGIETLLSILQTWISQEHWFLQFQIVPSEELTMLQDSSMGRHCNFSFNQPGFNTQNYNFPIATLFHKCPLATSIHP